MPEPRFHTLLVLVGAATEQGLVTPDSLAMPLRRSPQQIERLLAVAVELGYLQPQPGGYEPTGGGRHLARKFARNLADAGGRTVLRPKPYTNYYPRRWYAERRPGSVRAETS